MDTRTVDAQGRPNRQLGAVRFDVRVDVTAAVGTGEQLTVAATVVIPSDLVGESVRQARRTVIFGFPGGGYNRQYYDLQIPGHPGYSQAEHHLRAGHIFVGCDHLAVGDSDHPRVPLDFDAVARADAHAARAIISRLAAGTLAREVVPVEVGATAALGQSFGGFLLIIAQGAEHVFDGIGVLGYSALEPQTPWPDNLTLDDVLSLRSGNGRDHPMCQWFHYSDVPQEIVLADMTKIVGTLSSGAPWSTPLNPGGTAVSSARRPRDPKVVAADAARIEGPVLVACGSVDVVAEPRREPMAYQSSSHVTTAVIGRMAHMHNFASTRVLLWEVIDDWLVAVDRHASRTLRPS